MSIEYSRQCVALHVNHCFRIISELLMNNNFPCSYHTFVLSEVLLA